MTPLPQIAATRYVLPLREGGSLPGFVGSTTVVPGLTHRTDDPYTLHRLRVLGGTTPAGLLAQIAGAREAPPAPPSYSG